MRFSNDDIKQGVVKVIRDTAGAVPPIPVLAAMLALVPDQEFDHVVASWQSSDEGTVWHIVAVTGQALLLVDASSSRRDWVIGNVDAGAALIDGEQLDAKLVPLAEITAVRVVQTTDFDTFGEWTFNAHWRVGLRDGTEIDISPAQSTSAAREACDELALDLADAVRGRSDSMAKAADVVRS